MKIVFLDRKSIGEYWDETEFERFGELIKYDYSTEEEAWERSKEADIIIVNKVPMNEQTIGAASKLKLVCVTATGTNNLDKEYLEKRGIAWRNVAGYSTESVAQHTFAMLFYLYEHLPYYDQYVKSGKYASDRSFTHYANTFHELCGKTFGIIGLGAIGKRVAEIAKVFGCEVQYYSTSGRNHASEYKEVDLETLLSTSDIISIHAPLNDDTYHLMDKEAFQKMKKSAILLNAGRGPIVVDKDLLEALENEEIAAAGLDVLDVEPMAEDSPFYGYQNSERLLITPHIAWAALESRQRLMHIIAGQIAEFLQGQTR